MTGLQAFEFERLEYLESGMGLEIASPVTGRPILYLPVSVRRSLCAKTYVVIVALISLVIAAVTFIFLARTLMTEYEDKAWKKQVIPTAFGVITSAQIFVMNMVYDRVARALNDYENHRTQSEYDNALILKTVLFQFVNSYSSLVYIAFIKPFVHEECVGGSNGRDCIAELSTQLGSIFGFGLVVSNVQEVGIPAFNNYMANDAARVVKRSKSGNEENKKEKDEDEDEYLVELTALEEQFVLEDYSIEKTLFEDYLELMVQFGYATLFSAAYPLAPLLAMVNNYVELRVDAWKLCQQTRRAEAVSAETIGTWQLIVEVMSTLAVQVALTKRRITTHEKKERERERERATIRAKERERGSAF